MMLASFSRLNIPEVEATMTLFKIIISPSHDEDKLSKEALEFVASVGCVARNRRNFVGKDMSGQEVDMYSV